MSEDIKTIEKMLENLKKDPMGVTYTEHYLELLEKRNLPDINLQEEIEKGNLLEIHDIQHSLFEMHFHLDNSEELYIIIHPNYCNEIILISSRRKNDDVKHQTNHNLEFNELYDYSIDLMNLYTKNEFIHGQTVEMESGFNIDFDPAGHPIGVEMSYASKRFKLQRQQLDRSLLECRIEITTKAIKIRLKVSLESEKVITRVYESEIANDYGIPGNTFDITFEIIDLSSL
jgi:hypothetical protein